MKVWASNTPVLPRLWFVLTLGLSCLAVGALAGANWAYLIQLLKPSSFEEFVRRVPALTPILAVVGLFATVTGLWYQAHRARFNLEIDLCLKMAERWDSEHLRECRAEAARSWLKDRRAESYHLDQVLDFLEDVGFLVSRRAIGTRSAWQFFGGIALLYFEGTVDYRAENETEDVEVWYEFDRLYNELLAVETASLKKHGKPAYKPATREELDDYFIAEMRLVPVERFTIKPSAKEPN
jgi:hypothetical protein